MNSRDTLAQVFSHFDTGCEFDRAEAFDGGLINHSWRVTAGPGSVTRSFFLQQLNTKVFPNPELVMQNITLVTDHLRSGASPQPTLHFLPLTSGPNGFLYRHDDDSIWRLCHFIENTRTVARLTGPDDAETAGRAYGRFLKSLAGFPAEMLNETLPGFHDTPSRWAALLQAHMVDACERAEEVEAEMDRLWSRPDLARGLTVLDLPRRVVHNDAKLSNVLLDAVSGQAVCVVDLDTVMPGSALHDFGDMMRTMCCLADEQETDLDLVTVDPTLLEALAKGFLAEAEPVLKPVEKMNLLAAGLVMTFEQAVRFLTDYLCGDVYYHTTRPAQNLDRCRNQLQLLESMYAVREELAAVLP